MNLIEHRVRERAYYIWEGEGCVHGRADAHWLRAEAEIVAPTSLLTVQPVAEASVVPSPAKTLKPKAPRAKAAVEAKPVKAAPKTDLVKSGIAKTPKALAAGLTAKSKLARASASAAGLH